ncbi:hypothetical protein [Pseudomonas putida]|uniref:hypothetical protein n=1 Tax=Pseudomonas putida TaxID=303 RepID=UPI0021F9047B|nr:hypothetical protein [Pseudomonas putida]
MNAQALAVGVDQGRVDGRYNSARVPAWRLQQGIDSLPGVFALYLQVSFKLLQLLGVGIAQGLYQLHLDVDLT